MQAFMQSLQMRWPVAATIGLSMVMIGQRAERQPLALGGMELGNLFFERAAGERHAERALLEGDLVGASAESRSPWSRSPCPAVWHQMQ
jgi:hypothetical protein